MKQEVFCWQGCFISWVQWSSAQFAGTPDLIHLLIHLLQLNRHVWAVHVIGMPHMVYTQIVPNQQVPLVWLPHARHQVLYTTAQTNL